MPDTRFPDRLRLPLEFEPARLAADMANFSSAQWIEHFVKQNYDGDWSALALRGPAGATHPVQMIYSDPGRSDYEETPMLAGSLYFRRVLASFGRMPAGPETIMPASGYGLRARRYAVPRNDGVVDSSGQFC